MANYTKGRNREYRAMRILEADGFETTRSAGSHRPADVIGWNTKQIRFISVKSGSARISALEREALLQMPIPENGTREVWRFPNRCREPLIEVL